MGFRIHGSLQVVFVVMFLKFGLLNFVESRNMNRQSFLSSNASSSSPRHRGLEAETHGNPIDECWRGDSNWMSNRMKLADCAVGFGSNAAGGKGGEIYVVTNPGDDPISPLPGTLRYGVIQLKPLWIIFEGDMLITLKNELIVTSNKTIDGRGASVHIARGPCITIQFISNVIIHGLNIHSCKLGTPGMVRSSTDHVGFRLGSDGDGITVLGATDIWIDHNSLWDCYDGLIDVTHASTAVTISNNLFRHHDKVMLLGHNDLYTADRDMKVTVAFNRFGPGCVQRMPRCRFGYFHVVNNDYEQWNMYAIGGSASPTIRSEGNRYRAPNDPDSKQVTKRDSTANWSSWRWESVNDRFLKGAYFVESGGGSAEPAYSLKQSFSASPATYVPSMTMYAGSLNCKEGRPC